MLLTTKNPDSLFKPFFLYASNQNLYGCLLVILNLFEKIGKTQLLKYTAFMYMYRNIKMDVPVLIYGKSSPLFSQQLKTFLTFVCLGRVNIATL